MTIQLIMTPVVPHSFRLEVVFDLVNEYFYISLRALNTDPQAGGARAPSTGRYGAVLKRLLSFGWPLKYSPFHLYTK